MSILTKVTINSVDVTQYLVSWEYERTFGDVISEITLKFVKAVNTLLALAEGQTLKVWRGLTTATDNFVFDGYVQRFESDGGKLTVTGLDKLWDLVRKEITHTYDSGIDASAGKISEIFKNIVTTYGQLNADSVSVRDSGTTYLLQKFVCNHTDLFERCQALAEVLDWQFYYRADTNKVYFEPLGYPINTNILTIGSNVLSVPKWQYDITEMVNDLTVVGAFQEIETTESGQIDVTTGYTTSSITLSFEPISVKVYGDASNPPTTLKVGGVPDSTSSYDYYVDKPQKKIRAKAGTTFTTNHYYELRYSLAAPIPVHLYNQSSIDSYGQFKKTITYTDIRTVADAENRGVNYLSKYAFPFIYATLKVNTNTDYGLIPGQTIRVIDALSSPTVDDTLLINKIRMRYPGDYDELDVGDKYWRLAEWQSKVLERVKRLEEQEYSNEDISYELITIENDVNSPVVIKNRYSKVETHTVGGLVIFIYGNTTYGILGTGTLGDTDFGAATLYWLAHGGNVYSETFYDEDFKDAVTDAVWDTAARQLIFDLGEVAQSTSIDYNNGTITRATLTAIGTGGSGSSFILDTSVLDTGTLGGAGEPGVYAEELSADGGLNFEAVDDGISHTFTNPGTDLRWRLTALDSGTNPIIEVRVSDYH